MTTPSASAEPEALPAVLELLDDVSSFLVGFEDDDDNGELVRSLLKRIADLTGTPI